MRSGKIKRQTQARIVSADRQEYMQLLKKGLLSSLAGPVRGLLCLIYQCVTDLAPRPGLHFQRDTRIKPLFGIAAAGASRSV